MESKAPDTRKFIDRWGKKTFGFIKFSPSLILGDPKYDHEFVRSFVTLCALKNIHRDGIIKNITGQRQLLAKQLNISESTLRRRLKTLHTADFVYTVGKNLFLRGNRFIAAKISQNQNVLNFQYNVKTPKTYRVDKNELKTYQDAHDYFFYINILENLARQADRQKHHLFNEGTPDAPQNVKNRKINNAKLERVLLKNQRSFRDSFLINSDKPVDLENVQRKYNPLLTLSRAGVAGISKRKCKRTGTNIIKRLKLKGLLEDRANFVTVAHNVPFRTFIEEIKPLHPGYFFRKNSVYLRLSNSLLPKDGISKDGINHLYREHFSSIISTYIKVNESL